MEQEKNFYGKNSDRLDANHLRIGTVDSMPDGTSWLCEIPGDSTLVYGKIQGLLGKSLYETDNVENQYMYCVFLKDKNGEEIFLDVYSGPSGPAIGGLQNEHSSDAAERLLKLIEETEPVDYEYEGFYWDGPSKISQGIRNGVPYYNEESLGEFDDMDDDLDGLDDFEE